MGRRGAVRGLNSFLDGMLRGARIASTFRAGQMNNEIAEVDQQFTPTQTEAASGDEAMQAAEQAKEVALGGITNDAERQQIEANFQPTLDALTKQKDAPASTLHSMGAGQNYQQREQPFTQGEVAGAKADARSGIYQRYGEEDQAARVMRNEANRRTMADDTQIRTLLSGDGVRKIGLEPIGTSDAPNMAGKPAAGLTPQPSFLETVSPKIRDAYLRQGKIEQAKAWSDFAESEQGRVYANTYGAAARLIQQGDFDGAIPHLNQLYSSYPDGKRAQTENLGDGTYKITMFDERTGQQTGSRTMKAADLAQQAMVALSPTKLVEFQVQQNAKRASEAAALDKSLQLENLRQQGQETREDRRDERTRLQIEASDRRHAASLAARDNPGRLTQAQQRSNFEIDAAREMVDGLSAEDIRLRTSPTTATGRENPNFDPALSRAAKLAERRKIGDDEWFDQRQGRQPKPETFGGKPISELTDGQLQQYGRSAGTEGKAKIDAELARRSLAGMPGMEGHGIGQYVEGKGYQVLNAEGKLVSYLRRK